MKKKINIDRMKIISSCDSNHNYMKIGFNLSISKDSIFLSVDPIKKKCLLPVALETKYYNKGKVINGGGIPYFISDNEKLKSGEFKSFYISLPCMNYIDTSKIVFFLRERIDAEENFVGILKIVFEPNLKISHYSFDLQKK